MGTYQYYCPKRPDVEYYFRSIRAHNTVEIDGTDPLENVSRFLWFPWPRCQCLSFQPSGGIAQSIEAISYDYRRPPISCVHRRTLISLPNDVWLVVDDVQGRHSHNVIVRWHLADVPYEATDEGVCLETPKGDFSFAIYGPTSLELSVVKGRDREGQVQGFASPYYGQRMAIPTAEGRAHTALPARFISVFCPGKPPKIRQDVVSQTRPSSVHRIWRLEVPSRTYILWLPRCEHLPPGPAGKRIRGSEWPGMCRA